jgi:hypothetical protein
MRAASARAPTQLSQCLFLCRFLGRRRDETHHALVRPASEKRQGTKSREVGQRRCSELQDLAGRVIRKSANKNFVCRLVT